MTEHADARGEGSVALRIEPSRSGYDAFRVLANPGFFVDSFQLHVHLVTGGDEVGWNFWNFAPLTADEGWFELSAGEQQDPLSLDAVTEARVEFHGDSGKRILPCTILEGRTANRIEAECSAVPAPTPSANDIEAHCSPEPLPAPTPSAPSPIEGSVALRIEPSRRPVDAFRVLVNPTFFVDRNDLDVYVVTGDDRVAWHFWNDVSMSAEEGWWELSGGRGKPQPLEAVAKAKMVFDGDGGPEVLLCTLLGGRTVDRVEADCVPEPPPPPSPDGAVGLRIEPSRRPVDAFRVLVNPTFFVDRNDLDVYVVTGDDEATWELSNTVPITAEEDWWELSGGGGEPQPLEAVTKAKVVFDGDGGPEVLLCTILDGRTAGSVELECLPGPPPLQPPSPLDGTVGLRIEPSEEDREAFRLLANPTFFVDSLELDVYIVTDDGATAGCFSNDVPITADEGWCELEASNAGRPLSLDEVTKVKAVVSSRVLVSTILEGRTSDRVEVECSPGPPPPPPPLPFDGTVDLRIEPSQSDYRAFRVLADPTFFVDGYDMEVFIVTGDDEGTWQFYNDVPITADEGWWELSGGSGDPQSLEAVTRAKVVFDAGSGRDHVLLCEIDEGRTDQRIEAHCAVP